MLYMHLHSIWMIVIKTFTCQYPLNHEAANKVLLMSVLTKRKFSFLKLSKRFNLLLPLHHRHKRKIIKHFFFDRTSFEFGDSFHLLNIASTKRQHYHAAGF